MNFSDLENSDDSTIFNNFQFQKYANFICKLAYSLKYCFSKFERKLGPPLSILKTTNLFARMSCLN